MSAVMVETTSVAMGGGGQSPAVLRLGWWPVAEAEEMTAAEAVSAMAVEVAVMEVAAAAAMAVRGALGSDQDLHVRWLPSHWSTSFALVTQETQAAWARPWFLKKTATLLRTGSAPHPTPFPFFHCWCPT